MSKAESANTSIEPMCSANPNRPDHNHRENPLLFSNSDVCSLTSPLNHDREDTGDGTYGLASLSEKTRKSNLMQMS